MSGTGGVSKPSIQYNPSLDSSESTTKTFLPLRWNSAAISATTVDLPLPPLPQMPIFISSPPFPSASPCGETGAVAHG